MRKLIPVLIGLFLAGLSAQAQNIPVTFWGLTEQGTTTWPDGSTANTSGLSLLTANYPIVGSNGLSITTQTGNLTVGATGQLLLSGSDIQVGTDVIPFPSATYDLGGVTTLWRDIFSSRMAYLFNATIANQLFLSSASGAFLAANGSDGWAIEATGSGPSYLICPVINVEGKMDFFPSPSQAGLNVGGVSGNPSSLTNGDLWVDLTSGAIKGYSSGSVVTIGGSGGGGFTGMTSGQVPVATGANGGTSYPGFLANATGDVTTHSLDVTTGAIFSPASMTISTTTGILTVAGTGGTSLGYSGAGVIFNNGTIPTPSATYDLGTSSNLWRDIWSSRTANLFNAVVSNVLNLGSGSGAYIEANGTNGWAIASNGVGPSYLICPTINVTGQMDFFPTTTLAGLNVGSVSGNPSTNVNGDIWVDSTSGLIKGYSGSAVVTFGGGSGGTGFSGMTSGQVAVATSATGGTSYAGFTTDTSGNVTAHSLTVSAGTVAGSSGLTVTGSGGNLVLAGTGVQCNQTFIPGTSATYDLGGTTQRWRDIFSSRTANLFNAVVSNQLFLGSASGAFLGANGTGGWAIDAVGAGPSLLICPTVEMEGNFISDGAGFTAGNTLGSVSDPFAEVHVNHIVGDSAGGGSLSLTINGPAGSGASGSRIGTNAGGQISVTGGTGASAGNIADINWGHAYGNNPYVVFNPANAASDAVAVPYPSTSTAHCDVIVNFALANGTTYLWNYIVVQTTN